jgi:hypothetical protein
MVEQEGHDNELDGLSFMTAMTDVTTAPATPECIEKLTAIRPAQERIVRSLAYWALVPIFKSTLAASSISVASD